MPEFNGTLVRRNRFFSWRHLNPITGKYTQETIRDETGKKITDEQQARNRMLVLAAEKYRIESMKTKADYIQQFAEAQQIIQKCKVRFKDLREAFENHPARHDGQLENKISTLNHIVRWMTENHPDAHLLGDMTEEMAGEYLVQYWKSGISAKTYNTRLQCLKMIFRLFLKEDSPFKDYPYKQGESESREAFTPDQLKAIWDVLASDYPMMFKDEMIVLYFLAVYTGARCGDLCQLQWDSVDLNRNLLHLIPSKTKGSSGKQIEIPIAHALREQLERALRWKENEFVLPNVCKRYRYNPCGISHDTTALLEQAGIITRIKANTPHRKLRISRYGFHSFRHCYATMLINQGVNPLVVCDLMGHTTTAMTARYSHIALSTKTQAINELPDLSLGKAVMEYGLQPDSLAEVISHLPVAKLTALAAYLESVLSPEQRNSLVRYLQ